MNANEIITVTFTDAISRASIAVDHMDWAYIPVLERVEVVPMAIENDYLGLGVYTVTAIMEPRDFVESGCCDSCGLEHTPLWREDSAGWECIGCLVKDAIEYAHEEQDFRSAEQNADDAPPIGVQVAPDENPYEPLY